jgi:uncharacterized protein
VMINFARNNLLKNQIFNMTAMQAHSDQISYENAELQLKRLQNVLSEIGLLVVAVSGGIDSTLLAIISARQSDVDVQMVHAISPAVPELATQRVQRYARTENWRLRISDAGEFRDSRYLNNPVDRCFYCKSNLYRYITEEFKDIQVVSGANCSDLTDYRPGLKAATEYGVRHPYVEAGISKSGIREIARFLNLDDLSELPASPCLSSRVETGIRIESTSLNAIDRVETEIKSTLRTKAVRCRIRREGIVVELDNDALSKIGKEDRQAVRAVVQSSFSDRKAQVTVEFEEYRMGSAFIRETK